MKLIGKGKHSTVYHTGGDSVVIRSNDPVKECAALWGLSDSRWFPQIEQLEYGERSVYKMEYFPRVKSLKAALEACEYRDYCELRLVRNPRNVTKYDRPVVLQSAFKSLTNQALSAALIEAVDSLRNYSNSIFFEISPRNVAVKNGKLILLDVFFILE